MARPAADEPSTGRIKLYPFWGFAAAEAPKLAPNRELTLEHIADTTLSPDVIVPSDGLVVVAVYIDAEKQHFLPVELPLSIHGRAGFTLYGFLLTPGDRHLPRVMAGQRFAVIVRNNNPEGTADVPVTVGVLGDVRELFVPSRPAASAR